MGPATAGEYFIEKGDGVAVCEAYRNNLNAMKPQLALGCGERTRTLLAEISVPNWKPLDSFDGYPKLLPKIWGFLWNRDVNQAFYHVLRTGDWHATKQQISAAYRNYYNDEDVRGGAVGRPLASVDIDNDGKQDNLYLDTLCTTQGALLLVLNDDSSEIDRKTTSLITRHPSWKSQHLPAYRKAFPGESLLAEPSELQKQNLKFTEDALHFADYNVFMFGGKTYFDLWWSAHPEFNGKPGYEAGTLRVFLSENKKTTEVCSLRFKVAN